MVHLNDGSAVEGIVKRNGDGYDVTDTAGKLTHIVSENVRGIELTAKGGAGEAESRLGSRFRRAESAVSDNISCDVMPKRRKLGLERPAPIQLPLFAEAGSLIRVRPALNEWRYYRMEIWPDLFGRALLLR